MILLALGLLLFLGVHSARILAPGAREAAIARIGEGPWKGLYALLSLGGLMLVGRGWTAATGAGSGAGDGVGGAGTALLYAPVPWGPALSLAVMPVLFMLVVAGNLPAGRIRRVARHPMLVATVGWGVLHLFNNGTAAAVLLFAAFALWAAADIASLLRRERAAARSGVAHAGAVHAGAGPHGAAPPPDGAPLPWWPDIAALVVGLALYAWFVAAGHEWLFGVSPLG